jgi:uncharacterized protein
MRNSLTTPSLIPGPAGNLEISLEKPQVITSNFVGIACHPHPLYDGTMNNKVVTTLSRAFNHLGLVSIRFNFRGVGKSEGEYAYGIGEVEDLRAVIEWSRQQFPGNRLLLAGFSFGSFIAAKMATEVMPEILILVAPPVHYDNFKDLTYFPFPTLVVQGENDEVIQSQEVFAWVDRLSPQPKLIRMPGVGHFFHGKLIELRDSIFAFLKPIITSSPGELLF